MKLRAYHENRLVFMIRDRSGIKILERFDPKSS